MDNPYNPIKEKRHHDFYTQGYEKGKTGFTSPTLNTVSRVQRTSWSKGYHDAHKHRQMKQLILGDKYYDYVYKEQNPISGHHLLDPDK